MSINADHLTLNTHAFVYLSHWEETLEITTTGADPREPFIVEENFCVFIYSQVTISSTN